MLCLNHLPSQYGSADVQIFTGSATAAGSDWQTWRKPRGKSMVNIVLVGKGGNGGTGVIGANSTAAGGGGGGSGGQTSITMPLSLLPDILFLSLAGQSATTTLASYIALFPKLTAGAGAPVANDTLIIANGGGNGGNAAGATAGAAGAAAAIATNATMPLGWQFATALAGQAGIIGGTTVSAGALTLPLTGLFVTGGTGGGGLPAAAATGTTGGSFTVAGQFPAHNAPAGQATATLPPLQPAGGYQAIRNLMYAYGGLGSGSTHGTATGGGLVQVQGGNGEWGCGGGGNGGALTGSAAAPTVGQGGIAFAIITCW